MISPTLKIAGAIVGAGGVIVGGATGIYYLNNNKEEQKVVTPEKKKISSLLAADNRTLLDDTTDTVEWPKVWAVFSNAYTGKTPDGKWKIEEWTTNNNPEKGVPELKKLCKKNAGEEIEVNNKGELYEEVKRYCTKETKPSEIP